MTSEELKKLRTFSDEELLKHFSDTGNLRSLLEQPKEKKLGHEIVIVLVAALLSFGGTLVANYYIFLDNKNQILIRNQIEELRSKLVWLMHLNPLIDKFQ